MSKQYYERGMKPLSYESEKPRADDFFDDSDSNARNTELQHKKIIKVEKRPSKLYVS